MTYPVLQAARGFAKVDVRLGRGAAGWNQMTQIYCGACTRGQKWEGDEGDKLSASHCLMPNDPDSSMSLPYTQSSTEGLSPGVAELLRFPSGV